MSSTEVDKNKQMMSDNRNKKFIDSEDDVVKHKKLKCVLTKLMAQDFKLSDYTLLEKLFTSLLKQFNESDDPRKASQLSIFVPWLILVTKKWNTMKKCVKIFAFRLSSIVASFKPSFKTLFESGLLKTLCTLVKDENYDQSIVHGYADLLYSIVEFDASCKSILKVGLWRDMIHIALYSQSLYTSRRGRQCISSFIVSLVRSHSPDYSFPILDACFKHLSYGTNVVVIPPSEEVPGSPEIPVFPQHQPNANDIVSSISVVIEIIAELLNKKVTHTKISELLSRYKLNEWAWNVISDENENIEVITSTSKLLAYVNSTVIVRNENGEVEYTVMRALTMTALCHVQMLAQKHLFSLILDCCIDYQTLWFKHGGKIIFSEEDLQQETYEIENNLIITQCMPLFICMKVTRVMESDVMDMFADKVFSLSCKETQRVCYMYRDCLREAPDRSIEALCLQGIRSFFRIPTCFSKKEQAVMGFQCMMHTLKEFVPEEVSDISADLIVARRHPGENLVSRYPMILSALLDGLIMFISEFNITWSDSLETICILSFLQGLACNSAITPMLTAKTLQLMRLVIAKFIPPNLALLVDSLEGSSMGNLGILLRKKVNDIHWEVRDSAFEVMQAVTNIARARFPAFQNLIIETELPALTVSLMSTDPNSYVRASAISCIREMVKIQSIWDQSLYNKKILDLTINCLIHDTEGLVRYQAALLAKDLYDNQVIPAVQFDRLLDTMVHISIKDLHWETKLGCLEFWKSVISKAKSKEGMMDGEFPSITFSSLKKKIITLDPPEIRSRLGNLLSYLASTGCLLVLWLSLNDDCDLDVVKLAKNITEDLLTLLNKYDVVKHMNSMGLLSLEKDTNCSNIDITLQSFSKEVDGLENEEMKRKVDDVIEEIVSSEDVELLSRMAQVEVRPRIKPPTHRETLSPTEFLAKVLSLDLNLVISARLTWLRESSDGLNSLLEDILTYSQIEPNLTDCY